MIIARKTHSTANPRGKRARWSIATNGFSSNATSAATMKISATGPAARSDQERADDRQWQYDRLDPARDDRRIDRCGRGIRLRCGRIAGLGLERRVLHSARADVVLALLHARSMRTRADGALASAA